MISSYKRSYYLKNREKILARQALYYQKRREIVLARLRTPEARARANEIQRKRYRANPEKMRAQKRAWVKANSEKVALLKACDYIKHRNKRRRTIRLWSERNRTATILIKRRWAKAHPHCKVESEHRRRARKLKTVEVNCR